MNIYSFLDYRIYLKSWIKSLPKQGRGQVNRIAEALSVNPTLISQILSGSRDFTESQAYDLSAYLGLSDAETDYFLLLVSAERAQTYRYKNHLQQKIKNARAESEQLVKKIRFDRKLTDGERALFYSSYLYSAVRLFCSTGDQTVEKVSRRFSMPRGKAQKILEFLVSSGLCTKDKSYYRIGPEITHLEHSSPFISRHHTNWRLKALERIEWLTEEELMFSAPLSLSRKDFLKLREGLSEFIKKAATVVKDSKAEDVACLNMDLFWVER